MQHEIRFSTVLRIVATAAVAGSVVYGTALAQTPGPNTAAQAPAVPVPTNTPIYDIDHPPQSVAAPLAVDSCANDVFLAQRAIPAPTRSDVTVCGTVIAATAGATHVSAPPDLARRPHSRARPPPPPGPARPAPHAPRLPRSPPGSPRPP